MSLTYLAVIALTGLGLENAEQFVEAIVVIVVGLTGLYGRFRLGDLKLWGGRK